MLDKRFVGTGDFCLQRLKLAIKPIDIPEKRFV